MHLFHPCSPHFGSHTSPVCVLALFLGVASSASRNNSGSSQQQCKMTARTPALPSAMAFVPPSSTKAVSNHRIRSVNRRTVPLVVLKDPTDVGGQTTGGGDGGCPPENAPANNSAGPENSYATPSTSSSSCSPSTPSDVAVPLMELEDHEDYLNREFTNDFILNGAGPIIEEGLWNSGGSGPKTTALEEEAAATLEQDESATAIASSVPVLGGDLDPYLAEHEAAEQLFIETVVREGDNNVVRIEGIPPLGALDDDGKEEEVPSVNDDKVDASSTTTQCQIPTLSQIVKFALPATAIYLCDPLLSLIDTASVGLLAKSTAHQAALSPAKAVVNYSALLLAFLFVGATNFVAQVAAKTKVGAGTNVGIDSDDKDNGKDTTSSAAGPAQILLSTLQISLHTGTLLGVVLFALAPTLIALLSGKGSLPPLKCSNRPSSTCGSGPWDFPPRPCWAAPRRPASDSRIPPPPSSCWEPPPYSTWWAI